MHVESMGSLQLSIIQRPKQVGEMALCVAVHPAPGGSLSLVPSTTLAAHYLL